MLVMLEKQIRLREEIENRRVGGDRSITTRNYTQVLNAFLMNFLDFVLCEYIFFVNPFLNLFFV